MTTQACTVAVWYCGPVAHCSYSHYGCAHFCSEWCIVGYGIGVLWDWSIGRLAIKQNDRHFADNIFTYLSNEYCCILIYILLKFVHHCPIINDRASFGLDYGFAPNSWHAIFWANHDLVYWPIYSISQEICTRFCCALLCCGYAIVHNEFTWSSYPYSLGLLCWHRGNR